MKYTFFYSGPFSNWHKSYFKVDKNWFSCMEQYMMYMKAILFEDKETANKILDERNPEYQKALGRQVKNFDATKWDSKKENIVFQGLKAKFEQNPGLMIQLKASKGLLIEASPDDRIWGIGFSENTALQNEDKWGENLLGKLLTKLRDNL